MILQDSIRYLKGVGPATAARFEKLGIRTAEELLSHYPRRYIDFSCPYTPDTAPTGVECVVKGTVFGKQGPARLSGGRTLYRARLADEGGVMDLSWFNMPYIFDKITIGETYCFAGRVNRNGRRPQMVSPTVHSEREVAGRPLQAIYRQTEGLNSNAIAKCIAQVLPLAHTIADPLPEELLKKYRLPSRGEAVRAIHCPQNIKEAEAARRRLIFEELFILQCGMTLMKSHGSHVCSSPMKQVDLAPFWASLPYAPTGAQKRAAEEILKDMSSQTAMNRLLQGDVGSGKTLVAAAAVYAAHQNGYQSALMAPTEILAGQHADNLQDMLAPFGIRVALLKGGMKAAERRTVLQAIASGEAALAVGTHALLGNGVDFASLGLAVVDEQHRFGVRQRSLLAAKAADPHLLVMSATPIPRTLALLMYGDLDISILNELPPGRTPVKTWLVGSEKRTDMFGFLQKQISAGHQVYIVCPLIETEEEDPNAERQAAKDYIKNYAQPLLPEARIGLLHGKMKTAEKTSVMDGFKSGELDVLVSTTVVEVGVDVPNATCMVIENAERYGLSTLHQLRGRVGRGKAGGCCLLVSDHKGENSRERLKFLCSTTDGFEIARYDLETRGPGDFFGSAQHGIPGLQIADLAQDSRALYTAQQEASLLLAADPELKACEHKELARQVEHLFEKMGPLN